MKKIFLFGSIAAMSLLSACEKDDNNDNNNVSNQDQTFMMQASMSNSAEIAAGTLAAQKGQSAGVKQFGQMMVMEHTQAQNDLKTLGTTVNWMVKDTIDAAHVQKMAYLNSLSGYSFDTAYIHSQVMDHQTTLNLFNTEISNGNNSNVKDYATKYQPHIQMHLNMADSINQKM
jgi:putative membrane protein